MENELSAEHLRQEVTVTLPLGAVLRLGNGGEPLEREALGLRAAFQRDTSPEIGEAYEGGIYAGLSLHDGLPVELVLLPDDEELKWVDAVAWGEKQGGSLPSRIDQLVLLQNLKSEFKERAYWSSEQDAGDSAFAWYQSFSYGDQFSYPKDGKLRARAVRRLPI
jgi:hypothetical protein